MNDAPTVVRLLRFPATLHLTKKGNQYFSGMKRSGPLILSGRHDAVTATLKVNTPGVTFSTGGTSISYTEAFNEGEQRDLLLPWELVVEHDARPETLLL